MRAPFVDLYILLCAARLATLALDGHLVWLFYFFITMVATFIIIYFQGVWVGWMLFLFRNMTLWIHMLVGMTKEKGGRREGVGKDKEVDV